MAAVYADLGQRIADSAIGLTSSAFAGAPGVETEVHAHGPLGFGKGSSATARSSLRGVVPTDFSRNTSSKESSRQHFRSTSGWVKNVEREYEDFASGASTSLRTGANVEDWIQPLAANQVRSGWEMLWAHKRIADLPTGRQSIVSDPNDQLGRQSIVPEANEQLDEATPIWERSSRGEVVYQEDGRPEWKWRHEWKRINKHISREVSKQHSDPASETAFELELATRMDGIEIERYVLQSSALARLQLLKQHLVSTRPEVDHMQSWKQDWEMQQHERCDWTVEREYDHSPANQEEPEDIPDRYYFHCPWRDCHHRLLRQNENLTLAIRQRACVHHGCGYVSDSVESWLKHVTSTHHDLESVHSWKGDDDRSSCDGCASSDSEHFH